MVEKKRKKKELDGPRSKDGRNAYLGDEPRGRNLKKKGEAARQRQNEALKLRRQGFTYDQIARQLNYSGSGAVVNAVKAALERVVLPDAVEVVKIELERLEEMYRISFGALAASLQNSGGEDPNFAAMDRCIGIIDRKLRLVGGEKQNINLILGDQINNLGTDGKKSSTISVGGNTEKYIEALKAIREEAGERAGLPEHTDVDAAVDKAEIEDDSANIIEAELVEEDDGGED